MKVSDFFVKDDIYVMPRTLTLSTWPATLDDLFFVDKSPSRDNVPTLTTRMPRRTRGKTEEMLALSIFKWYFISQYNGLLHDGGTITCGLCHLYFDGWCEGCLIKNETGSMICEGTPYARYCEALTEGDLAKAQSAAQEEMDFLRQLWKKHYKTAFDIEI